MSSIRFRVTAYFLGLILLFAAIFIIGMNNFIDSYYYGKKIESMITMIDEIDKMFEVSSSDDEALMNIEYMGYRFEGKISIYDQNSKMIVYDNKRFHYTEGVIVEEINFGKNTAYVYETSYPVEGARWLMYIDKLSNGKVALLQIPVVAIDEALNVVSGFFNYLLIIALILAFVLAIFLARNISLPIKRLHQVANSIGSLEFDIKYEGKRTDEIGQLGSRLNQISVALEKNIHDLHKELEKEKKIDRLRRHFIAQVSHELPTRISIISSYVEALNDGLAEEDEIVEYYKVIEDESGKMSHIIKDLLQLSQLEADTLNFNMNRIEATGYIEEICTRYGNLAKREGLEFYYTKTVKGFQYIIGDSFRLEQGITNLLSNAIKHSSGLVRVTLTKQIDSLKLCIENSGDRIDEADLEHIFDSFYKGKTSKKKEGTGLGLSIASQIFNKHNIFYKVSNLEEGVLFELNIPLVKD